MIRLHPITPPGKTSVGIMVQICALMQLLVADEVKPVNNHHFVLDGSAKYAAQLLFQGAISQKGPLVVSPGATVRLLAVSALQDI